MTSQDTQHDRWIGRAALAAAVVGTVVAPVHALSRYATGDGKEDAESPLVRAWAEPAADALRPLLTWSDADTVYLTWGKVWVLVFLAATLCAIRVRRRRTPTGAEAWAWRVALAGYGLVTVGSFGSYWTPLLDEFFLLTVPGLLASMAGSTVLGVVLLRRGFRPRATAVLLACWFPAMVVLSNLIALGAAALPMVWAWASAGRDLGTEQGQVTRGEAVRAA